MTFLILEKETDKLIDILEDLSPEDIEKYESENPDQYIIDEDNTIDEFLEEDMMDYNDLW